MGLLNSDLNQLLPELTLTVGALALLLYGLSFPSKSSPLKWLTVGFQGANLSLCYILADHPGEIFSGQLTLGPEIYATRLLVATAGLLITLVLSFRSIGRNQLEYFLFLFGLQIGAQITVMASHAVTILLAVELLSISSYALASYHFVQKSSEAGMKYFIFGSTATALMAFGFSWIYGMTGSLTWASLSDFLSSSPQATDLGAIGFYFLAAGLLFKLSAAPMHFWAPDVFETTPLPVINLLSTLPKIASVILLSRLVTPELYNNSFWISFVTTVSVLTLILGHLPALWQTNARRLLGYSSIAQAGFLLAGLSIAPGQQATAILFYLISMVVAVTLVAVCLEWFESNYQTGSIDSFSGLGKVAVLPSAGLTIGLVSLTGLPPFAGFSAKLLLFSSIWSSHPEGHPAITILLVLAILTTVIALFFYIKIPLELYLKNGREKSGTATLEPAEILWMAILSGILIALFLYPQAVEFLFLSGT